MQSLLMLTCHRRLDSTLESRLDRLLTCPNVGKLREKTNKHGVSKE
jgi:hypothetical protein